MIMSNIRVYSKCVIEKNSSKDQLSGGLVLIGKAAVLKTAGLCPLGVRVPRPPLNL